MPFKKGHIPHNAIDLTGKKINMLYVESFAGKYKGKNTWNCLCDCGNKKTLSTCDLVTSNTKSCGCLKKKNRFKDLTGFENNDILVLSFSHKKGYAIYWNCRCKHCGKITPKSTTNIKRGEATCKCIHYKRVSESRKKIGRDTPIYSKWLGMKNRCLNKNEKCYKNYGGRGIIICDEWMDFYNFYKWALENGYQDGYSLERKDVNGNYCPENCCWIPLKKQAENKRNTLYVEIDGETKRLIEWCKIYDMNYKTVYQRIKLYGMDPKDALIIRKKVRIKDAQKNNEYVKPNI